MRGGPRRLARRRLFVRGWCSPAVAAPTVVCGKGLAMSLFDADGDGELELLEPSYYALQLLDGPSGQPMSTTPDLGASMPHLQCTAIEADGTPGDELACIHSN